MNHAVKTTVSAFGILAALAGLEHGLGEVLQGNKAPDTVVIQSWPDSPWFAILAGEPAMTLVPNLLVSGILSILVSLAFLEWVTVFIHGKHGGIVLVLLSILLLLVGGGFGPPLLGLILGIAAMKIHSPLAWWREHLSSSSRRLLAEGWPWLFGAGLLAWLMLLPGSILIDHFIGVSNPELFIPVLAFAAFGFLLLAIVTALARDTHPQADVQPRIAIRG